jgi:hypothetical protein
MPTLKQRGRQHVPYPGALFYLEDGNNTILPYIVSVESATQTWFGKDVRQPLRQNGRHALAFRQPPDYATRVALIQFGRRRKT